MHDIFLGIVRWILEETHYEHGIKSAYYLIQRGGYCYLVPNFNLSPGDLKRVDHASECAG